jgi:hypoxanthine phosphoribosyltransferase
MEKAISEKELDIQIKILAKKISDEHRNDPTPVVLVCILNGGFMFFSDLVKQINIPIEIDFIRCKSYYGKKQGDLVVTKDSRNQNQKQTRLSCRRYPRFRQHYESSY